MSNKLGFAYSLAAAALLGAVLAAALDPATVDGLADEQMHAHLERGRSPLHGQTTITIATEATLTAQPLEG